MDMNYRGDCGREGVGRMEWSGGGWDNCNSIINKYIKKKFPLCIYDVSWCGSPWVHLVCDSAFPGFVCLFPLPE